ncbi:MAG: hypothetical protein ACRC0G_07245 [Fusobacteriaceae bacterium]
MIYVITPNGEFSTVVNKELIKKIITIMVINPELYMDEPKDDGSNYKLSEVIKVADIKNFNEKYIQESSTVRPYIHSMGGDILNEYIQDLIDIEEHGIQEENCDGNVDTAMKYSEVMGSLDMILLDIGEIESLELTRDTIDLILEK